MVARSFLPALTALLMFACGDGGATPETPCSPGARLCDGERVLVCTNRAVFEHEQGCPASAPCFGGRCVPLTFDDAVGDVPQDTSKTPEVWTQPDTSVGADAVADTPRVDVVVVPDTVGDAGPDTVADAAPDADADAGPDTATAPDTVTVPDTVSEPDTAPVSDTTTEADTATEPDLVTVADAEPDTASEPDTGPGPEPDPYDPGLLLYQKVNQSHVTGDLHRVRWHPSGDYALILGSGGHMLRYDAADGTVSHLTDLVGHTLADVDTMPSGDFLVVGTHKDGKGRVWAVTPGEDGLLVTTEAVTLPHGSGASVVQRPGTGLALIVSRVAQTGGFYVNYLFTYTADGGFSPPVAYSATPVNDVMWLDPAIYGSDGVVTAENGAGSQTWLLGTNKVVPNGWSPGFGNAGQASWRPGGAFGFVAGWSSNVVYVFDGAWTSAYLPYNNGMGTQAIGWKPDGTRALIVGRATGNPMVGTVVEYRAGLVTAFDKQAFVAQGIPGFDKAPWSGNFNTYLKSVDWRPNVACDSGLIVGSPTVAGSYPLIVHFHDSADPACLD